jgi:hypothetical protein
MLEAVALAVNYTANRDRHFGGTVPIVVPIVCAPL